LVCPDFFESFYEVGADGRPDDKATIGPMVTTLATRFHYNSVENAIIKAIANKEELPYGATAKAWEMFKDRENLRLLDIGSGSGHWIDFFMDTLYVKQAVGVEIAENTVEHLKKKYQGKNVEIISSDIGGDISISGKFDYISAIGVIFHIVDDRKWQKALVNLKSLLNPEGLLLIGGDFGEKTRNVQFHTKDKFGSWSESVEGDGARVNKRVRSLSHWRDICGEIDLKIIDVVRADIHSRIHTPENDILVLQ
jgi:SAM-dependent methyltransferase